MSNEDIFGLTPTAAATTVDPSMEERIVATLRAAQGRPMKWTELLEALGDKAVGWGHIQLSPTGVRDHNIWLWKGVSREFHDAFEKLRGESEKRVRIIAASPVGYFASDEAFKAMGLPIAQDYKIAYHKPHLFLTVVELTP